MKKIHKYPVEINYRFSINLPEDSVILSFQVQHNSAWIWVIVDRDKALERRNFRIFGTGHPLEDKEYEEYKDIELNYIGTIQLNGMVWHLFEDIK